MIAVFLTFYALFLTLMIRNAWVADTRLKWLRSIELSDRPTRLKIDLYQAIMDGNGIASYNRMLFSITCWSQKMEDWKV